MSAAFKAVRRENVLPSNIIRIDGGTQSRAQLDPQAVADYSESVAGGAVFPPVVVFFDGSEYWLADGFHRMAAFTQAGSDQIDVEIRQGTRREAILYSVGANEDHGLRRTNEDKRRAALTLLNDEEWKQWSDREIARRCNVSDRFVNNLRQIAVTANIRSDDQPAERTYINKHGGTSKLKVRGAKGSAKSKRKRRPRFEARADTESQHDRDLRMLLGVWEAACGSAREAFLNTVTQ